MQPSDTTVIDPTGLGVCKRYMNPGANPKQAIEQFDLSCECNGYWPCRDIDNNGCKPSASTDCKNAVQRLDDLWIKTPSGDIIPTDPHGIYCDLARYTIRMLATKCNN